VAYTWHVRFNMSSTCTGVRATCWNSSYESIGLFGNLFDNTTRTWVRSTNSRTGVDRLLGPQGGASGNWTVRLRFSTTLRSADRYLLYTGVRTSIWAESGCAAAGCFDSSAWIYLGGSPSPYSTVVTGAWLDSMTLS
jgi:hypothetical protein